LLRRLCLCLLIVLLSGCAMMSNLRQRIHAMGSHDNAEPASQEGRPGVMEPSGVPSSAPVGKAKLLKAPSDWGELAHDAAYRISQRATQVPEISSHLVYVSEPTLATPFAVALRKYVQSNLAEMGITVAQHSETSALVLDIDVQSLKLASGMQVVVSTSIGNGRIYLFRNTEAYAVNQADTGLYDASLLPPPPLPPSPVKTMTVTGQH